MTRNRGSGHSTGILQFELCTTLCPGGVQGPDWFAFMVNSDQTDTYSSTFLETKSICETLGTGPIRTTRRRFDSGLEPGHLRLSMMLYTLCVCVN